MTSVKSLRKLIGEGYDEFWEFKGRYRIVKGGRGSKKSMTTAFWIIINMMTYPEANTLVIRRYYSGHRNSTYAALSKVIDILGVGHLWQISKAHPFSMIYIPTGQQILFRGLDDPYKVASMEVSHGVLCWCWIEELWEIKNPEHFDLIDDLFRGKVPDGSGLFKQITCTFNPWMAFWAKTKFFDVVDPESPFYDPNEKNIFCLTTNYLCNEWLDETDRMRFETMKKRYPDRYLVAGLGNWGVAENKIFDNYEILPANYDEIEIKKQHPFGVELCGLDIGFEHLTAFLRIFIDSKTRKLWCFEERTYYHTTTNMIADNLLNDGYQKYLTIIDSANPLTAIDLRTRGLYRLLLAVKGAGSVIYSIQYLQQYTMYISPQCAELIRELAIYQWKKDENTGLTKNEPIKIDDDVIDALRYAALYIGKTMRYRDKHI